VLNLGALRRANPEINHLFTMAHDRRAGLVARRVEGADTAPCARSESREGAVAIGSLPPASLPHELIHAGMAGTAAEILDWRIPRRPARWPLSPIVAPQECGGLVSWS